MLIYLDEETAEELIRAISYFTPLSFNQKALNNIINQINDIRSEINYVCKQTNSKR